MCVCTLCRYCTIQHSPWGAPDGEPGGDYVVDLDTLRPAALVAPGGTRLLLGILAVAYVVTSSGAGNPPRPANL